MKTTAERRRTERRRAVTKRATVMTEAQIRKAALSDPDNPPLTRAALRRMRPVRQVKRIRHRLGLSQSEFAKTFGLSLSVLRDWEQGRCEPDQAAKTLLHVIEANPRAVRQALA